MDVQVTLINKLSSNALDYETDLGLLYKIFLFQLDWLSFQSLVPGPTEGEVKHWGNPELATISKWDYGTASDNPGPHMICDLNGIGLKWSDVKDGMLVKIKARNIHRKDGLPLYEFLYSTEGRHGKYFIKKAQEWLM